MRSIDIVRAWKDPEYRKSLSPEELATVPECPTGSVSDEELKTVAGGRRLSGDPFVTIGGDRCKTQYPECCYNSTIGPLRSF